MIFETKSGGKWPTVNCLGDDVYGYVCDVRGDAYVCHDECELE